jgi:hypothetical protein
MTTESGLLERFFPTAATARGAKALAAFLFSIGLIAAGSTLWSVGADLYARHSWPQATGELVSISEGSSAASGRASRRTRYWVEYVVHFVVPPAECRTGMTDGTDGGLAVCVGTIRTRSTQSAAAAGTWMREAFRERSVRVLYDPDGSDIKIAGEPVWLRYPWDMMLAMAIWIVLFGSAFFVMRRRVRMVEQ